MSSNKYRNHFSNEEIGYIWDNIENLESGEKTLRQIANELNRSESGVRKTYLKLGGTPLESIKQKYVLYKGENILATGSIEEIA